MRAPTPSPFVIFTFGFTFESIKEFGGVSPCLIKSLVMVILFLVLGILFPFRGDLNPNLVMPLKIQSQNDATLVMVQIKSIRMLNLLWLDQTPKT